MQQMRTTQYNTSHLPTPVSSWEAIHMTKLAPVSSLENFLAFDLNQYQYCSDLCLKNETLLNKEFHLFNFLSDWNEGWFTCNDQKNQIIFEYGFAEKNGSFAFDANKPFAKQILNFDTALINFNAHLIKKPA